jgi:enterochelin esterase-like enzyme
MAHPRTHEEIELPVEIRIDGMPHRRIPLYDNPDRSDKWAGKFSNSRMPRFVFPPLHEKDLPGSRQMFFYSKSMDVVGAYGIYLPPGYEPAGKKRYPVLYVCHGRGESGYHTSVLGMWLHKAIVAGQIPPMLAVFVNGTARGGFRDDDETGLLIETMVREELIPHVDGHFATIPRPRGRALLGFSMGAYACWNFGLDSLTPFVALGSIGGGGEPDPALAKSFVKNGGRLALWIGEKDILLDHNRKLHGMLDAQGIEHVFKEVPGLEHRHAHYYRDIGNDILAFFSTAFAEK